MKSNLIPKLTPQTLTNYVHRAHHFAAQSMSANTRKAMRDRLSRKWNLLGVPV